MRPGVIGGANWGGGAFDPATGHALRQDVVEHAGDSAPGRARSLADESARATKWMPTSSIARRQRDVHGRPAAAEAAVRSSDGDRSQSRRDRLARAASATRRRCARIRR